MLKDQLKLLREKRGLTKKEVANSIGISERAYIAYEYGERDVSTDTLVKIAKYYGVTTDYLLDIEPADPPNPLDLLNLSDIEKAILQIYINVSPKKRKPMEDFLIDLASGGGLKALEKMFTPENAEEQYVSTDMIVGTKKESQEERPSQMTAVNSVELYSDSEEDSAQTA